MAITRKAYEQGRVRRRDGRDFRIHAWHDETGTGRILGEVKITDGSWGFQHWNSEGKCRTGKSPLDLILAPRKRTVWVQLIRDVQTGVITPVIRKDGAALYMPYPYLDLGVHPIEIED